MIALFLKDFKIIKKTLPYIIGISLYFSLVNFGYKKSISLYLYSVFNVFIVTYAQLFFHEAKSISFIASLPVRKKDILIARYINGIIILILSLITGFITININSLFYFKTVIYINDDIVKMSIISLISILIYFAILNPVMLKTEKRLLSTAGSVCTAFITVLTTSGIAFINIKSINNIQNNSIQQLSILMIISVVLYLVSLYISILMYKRKEF